jgi:cysteine synthase A
MPDSMSIERRKLIEAYGAQIVLTDGKKGMTGAIEKAKELQQSMPNAYIPDQFSNPANAEAHYLSTGPEIYEALEGKVDVFVAGIGTGGTVTGVGKYLKEKNPNVKIVGVEPSSSPVLTKGISGSHGIQGIGAGFVPKVLDRNILDEVLTVTDEESVTSAKYLSREEGVSAGISSGAAFKAALKIAKRKENENKNVVVLLPDTGAKYLSTALYGD